MAKARVMIAKPKVGRMGMLRIVVARLARGERGAGIGVRVGPASIGWAPVL